jgi:hypothetical protein
MSQAAEKIFAAGAVLHNYRASGGWGRRPLYIGLTIWISLDRGIRSL